MKTQEGEGRHAREAVLLAVFSYVLLCGLSVASVDAAQVGSGLRPVARLDLFESTREIWRGIREIDPASGAALGNFPQGFTHVGLINAAISLAKRMEGEAPMEQHVPAKQAGQEKAARV